MKKMKEMTCLTITVIILLMFVTDSHSITSPLKRNLAKVFDTKCGDDIWCQKFCPFVHHLFDTSLTEPIACAVGLENQVNCTQKWFCATWCPYIFVQINVPEKPREWDICQNGGMPLGCRNDPSCVMWCDAIYQDYEDAPLNLQACMTRGQPIEGCDDTTFCHEVCDASRIADLKMQPTFVRNCGLTGMP